MSIQHPHTHDWYETRAHRSHVSAKRYSKRRNYGDIVACSVIAIAKRLGMRRSNRVSV